MHQHGQPATCCKLLPTRSRRRFSLHTCRSLQVDFAPPLDYKEPERQPPQQPAPMAADGTGAAGAAGAAPAEPAQPEEPKFLAFAGTARRLDGKPASESRPIAIPLPGSGRPGGTASGPASAAGSVGSAAGGEGGAAGSAPKRPGKVFGGNRLQAKLAEKAGGGPAGGGAPRPPPAPKKEDEEKKEDEGSNFKAFSGKGYSLKG